MNYILYTLYFISFNFRAQELIGHGKNALNLATASVAKVKEQAVITAKLIMERLRRDKLDQLEEWHRAESSGARGQQIEQEQNQQEQDSDDFFENSGGLLRHITEPSIELTVNGLPDIEGDDEVSLSILTPTIQELSEIEGMDESYPQLENQDNPLDMFLNDEF